MTIVRAVTIDAPNFLLPPVKKTFMYAELLYFKVPIIKQNKFIQKSIEE